MVGHLLLCCMGLLAVAVTTYDVQYTVNYVELNYPNDAQDNSTYLTGIRNAIGENSSNVYLSGFSVAYDPFRPDSNSTSFLYKGPIRGGGEWYAFEFPSSPGINVTGTFFYGPNEVPGKDDYFNIVGSYSYANSSENELGLLYQGYANGSNATWTTLHPQELATDQFIIQTIGHSTMGSLVLGNFYTIIAKGRCFIYDMDTGRYDELTYPDAESITGYSIYHNGDNSYTIAGGIQDNVTDKGYGFICDWDSASHVASFWRFFTREYGYYWTHFEGMSQYPLPIKGIQTAEEGDSTAAVQYTFASDYFVNDSLSTPIGTSFVVIPNISNASSVPLWIDFVYPNTSNNSANSVWGNYMIGKFSNIGSPEIAHGYVVEFVFDMPQEDDDMPSSSGGSSGLSSTAKVALGTSFGLLGLVLMGLAGWYWYFKKSPTSGASDERNTEILPVHGERKGGNLQEDLLPGGASS